MAGTRPTTTKISVSCSCHVDYGKYEIYLDSENVFKFKSTCAKDFTFYSLEWHKWNSPFSSFITCSVMRTIQTELIKQGTICLITTDFINDVSCARQSYGLHGNQMIFGVVNDFCAFCSLITQFWMNRKSFLAQHGPWTNASMIMGWLISLSLFPN